MKCNFCLENTAVINLNNNYNIIFLDSDFTQEAWVCEECHKKFRENKGHLKSKLGFFVQIP